MKRKICFFSGDITRGGGTERVSILIANALAEQAQYEVSFLSLVEQKPHVFFRLDPAVTHDALGEKWISPGPGYLAVLPKLSRYLKEKKTDVLIDIDLVLDVLSLPVCKRLQTKVISWGHFSFYFEQSSLYRRWIQKYSAKRADYIVTITRENARCYAQKLHRTERISTIYNPAEAAAADETVQKEKWILWVGRLVDIKGIEYLAKTAALVLKRHPDWKWIVVGDGEKRGVLEDVIAREGLQDRLVLAGTVADVAPYYRKAQVFVLTSKSEGLPMCLLEAKAYRLPCVSFDIRTGPNEIITDGVNGYLTEPYDCGTLAERIDRLLSDDKLRRQFAAASQVQMEKFQKERIIQDWIGVLEQVCG